MGKLVHRWIAVTVIVSLVAAVDGGWVLKWLTLSPDHVMRGELWRLVTWTLIVRAPFTLVVVGWLLYKFAGELAAHWGEPRLRGVALQLGVASALATCAIAAVLGKHDPHTCSSLTMIPLVILWGRQYPDREVVLYGMIPLKARGLVRYLSAFVGVCVVYYGLYSFAPELVGCTIALVYPMGWLRR
jgi:hypothetical protein